ncbi:MAG: GAF domain-containing protein [Actinomycetota bacterium]|nr:GAF domain-containing protein [Actinomycetota bacterium]
MSERGEPLEDWPLLMATARKDGVPNPRIGELCIELAQVAGAGISLMTLAGNSGVLYASDDTAAQIEELQFVLGEGPCMDAFGHGGPVFIADLEDPEEGIAQRWPAFLRSASELGVRAVYAIPLCIGAIRVGVMDLYRREPGVLEPQQLASALLLADVAALSLLHRESADVTSLDAGGRATYRIEVHQATGMVGVQTGRPLADALLLLRAHAFSEGKPVDAIARDVIAGRLRFPREGP